MKMCGVHKRFLTQCNITEKHVILSKSLIWKSEKKDMSPTTDTENQSSYTTIGLTSETNPLIKDLGRGRHWVRGPTQCRLFVL